MRGPGTTGRIRTGDGRRFMVEQRTVTRNAHGARKAVVTVYETSLNPRSELESFEGDLRDRDVGIDKAIEAVEFHTGETVEEVQKKEPGAHGEWVDYER